MSYKGNAKTLHLRTTAFKQPSTTERAIKMTNAMMTTSTTAEPTMSSREIAEVVESRHDNVKITIERLGVKGIVTFTATQEPTLRGGKPVTVYHVNKRDSYVVVAQLSPSSPLAWLTAGKSWRSR